MCSISGFLRYGSGSASCEVADQLIALLERSSERGRDSAGVIAVTRSGVLRSAKQARPKSFEYVREVIDDEVTVLIANNRAEPTTEFVTAKTPEDIQPFVSQHVAVTHNGVIANDREISLTYDLNPASSIDTAVLPPLIERLGVRGALAQVLGSYALAVCDTRTPYRLYLACNYKPVYLMNDLSNGILWFGSQEEYLRPEQDIWSQLTQPAVVEMPPYSMLEIDGDGFRVRETTLQPRERGKRAFIVCSGGLDSTVTAAWAQRQGYEITLLHFRYGCRAEGREVEAVKAIAKALDCPYRIEDLSWLGQLGGNPLTDSTIPLHENEAGAEFAHEWVPARNFVFSALAAALCDRFGHDTIMLGLNLEEGGAYPDNTGLFYRAIDTVCNIGTTSRPSIICPLANKVKHEIIEIGLEVNAPFHLSWSCYENGPYHCGKCGPCYMRKQAFKMNGVKDPTVYIC